MAEKSELLNEAEIDFLLTSAAEDEPVAPAAPEQEQTVTMRGDLQQINLADIFQTLAMAKMEGVLRLRNPLEERQVYCRDGYVQLLVTNRVATRRLGQRLIQAGLLTGDQLRAALIAQRKEKVPIGELLVNSGAVNQQDVDEIVGVQIAEDLFGLFTWKHGTFEFFKNESGSASAAPFEGCAEFEVNSLLLEVARRSDEWESIFDAIVSLEEVPERIGDPEDESKLSPVHQAVLASIDGHQTYRDLADHTTYGLFEAARAARDLMRGELCVNIQDDALVAVANRAAEQGEHKKAVVLLQALRDRPGDRSLEVLQAMAVAMQNAGERRLGGHLLLEAAQRQPEPELALDLARAAQTLSPHDPEVLSFLRTVLVAHGEPDSAELEDCTLALLDALIEAENLTIAIDIIDDARRTGTVRPQILVREARARQKSRDLKGAAEALFELGQLYEAQGNRPHAVETYLSLLRLDRSRKDVQKLVASLRRTRFGNLVRLGAAVLAVGMMGGMGFVFWRQHTFETQVADATTEISTLLAAGNRGAAKDRLADWRTRLGDCEPIEDLRSRVAFADAAERTRLEKNHRSQVNEQLTTAAELLGRGELEGALQVYAKLWQRPDLQAEVEKVVNTRFEVLLSNLEQAAKALQNNLPPEPGTLFDRRELTTNLADLQSTCPPISLRLVAELQRLHTDKALPEFLATELRGRIATLLANTKDIFDRTLKLATAYTEALQRNDQQRQLDPMFKAAVAREQAYDFAGALAFYRELENQPANDAELRAHFRDRVARNATIVRLMTALKANTDQGQFEAAQQQLRALRLSFPDVPFGKFVRLPLYIDSQPGGATVTCNGAEVGRTPILLARIPEQETRVEVALDGFVGESKVVADEQTAGWVCRLTLPPDAEWKHSSAVDVAPAHNGGRLFVVDRAGVVSATDEGAAQVHWTFHSGDLSGLLSQPLLYEGQVIFGSLDGDLRSLDGMTGDLLWSLPNLPTEVPPLMIGQQLILSTTDGKVQAVDLRQRTTTPRTLPEPTSTNLLSKGRNVYAIGERGLVMAFALPDLTPLWQQSLEEQGHSSAAIIDRTLVVANERGNVAGLDTDSGEVLWRRALDCELLGAPIGTGDRVLLVTPTALLALQVRTGRDQAKQDRDDQDWRGPAVSIGNRLVVALHGGPLQVLDPQSLKPLYRLRAPRRARVLPVGSTLLVVTPDHAIAAYRQLR